MVMEINTKDAGTFEVHVEDKKLVATLCKYKGSCCHFYQLQDGDYHVYLVVFRYCESVLPYNRGKWGSSWIVSKEESIDGQVKVWYSSCYSKEKAYQGKDFEDAFHKAFDATLFQRASEGYVEANSWCDFKVLVQGLKRSQLDSCRSVEISEVVRNMVR